MEPSTNKIKRHAARPMKRRTTLSGVIGKDNTNKNTYDNRVENGSSSKIRSDIFEYTG